MKKILCLHEDYTAVNTYRLHRYLDNIPNKVVKQGYLNKKRRTIQSIADDLKKKGDVWICKYLQNNPEKSKNFIAALLSAKRVAKAKLVVDLDDNIWKIPVSNPAFWDFKQSEAAMSHLVSEANYVVCSTEPLGMFVKKFNKNVVVLKNCINPKDWKLGPKKKNKKIRIGWIFSVTHVGDIRPVEQALTEIMEEFENEVEFILIGGAEGLFNFDYKYTKAVKSEDYIKYLEDINLDISICPLADNEFNQSKSNIKWLESSMAGAAVVAGKVYPYEHSIKNGKTGFVCGSKNQWKNAIRKLILDEQLRKDIVDNARKEILKDYNIEHEAIKYHNFIESL